MRLPVALAIALGILAPALETVRRWGTWREYPPALFDDYLLGALLLGGAWAVNRQRPRGRAILAAAWGFACGLGYASFFEQYRRLRLGEADPSGLPPEWVVAIKGAALAAAIVALILTLRGEPPEPDRKP